MCVCVCVCVCVCEERGYRMTAACCGGETASHTFCQARKRRKKEQAFTAAAKGAVSCDCT